MTIERALNQVYAASVMLVAKQSQLGGDSVGQAWSSPDHLILRLDISPF